MRAAERARSIAVLVPATVVAAMAIAAGGVSASAGHRSRRGGADGVYYHRWAPQRDRHDGLPLMAGLLARQTPSTAGRSSCTGTGRPGLGISCRDCVADGCSAIAANSPRNAWAVGGIGDKNLILHWNGTRWSKLPCPTPHHDYGLDSVTVTRTGAAWAAGFGYTRSGTVDVILRWVGGKWKQAANPAPTIPGVAAGAGTLAGVAASSDRDAWVVGMGAPGFWTVAARWNGSVWRQVPMPDIQGGVFAAVAMAPRREAWAVGAVEGNSNVRHSVLIMHWNGHSWRRIRSPNPPGATLRSVAGAAGRHSLGGGLDGARRDFRPALERPLLATCRQPRVHRGWSQRRLPGQRFRGLAEQRLGSWLHRRRRRTHHELERFPVAVRRRYQQT